MLQDMLARTTEMLGGFVPNLLGALGILIVGWIVARVVSSVVGRVLKRARFDTRVAEWTTGQTAMPMEQYAKSAVYWVIMLFVAIAVFQALDLPLVAEPLNELLGQLAGFVPKLAGAAILLLVAWVVATVLRKVVKVALSAAKLDERLGGRSTRLDTTLTVASCSAARPRFSTGS